jgi:hypothetical protein
MADWPIPIWGEQAGIKKTIRRIAKQVLENLPLTIRENIRVIMPCLF